MEITPDLRRLVHRAAPSHELREKLIRRGALTLREEGVRLALDGRSSLEEVLRVTHGEDERRGPEGKTPRRGGDSERQVA